MDLAARDSHPSRAAGRAGARPTRMLVITPDLGVGGAERHLLTVLPELDPARFQTSLLCIKERGALWDEFARRGIPAESLDAGPSYADSLRSLRRIVARIRAARPDVVMTRGFNADVLGRIAARIAGVPVVVTWKHNCGHLGREGPMDRAAERLLGRLTTRYFGVANGQVPYLVDYLGLAPAKIRVVHNAVDHELYSPDAEPDPALRAELGLAEDDLVVGMVAVLRPEKDHATAISAFARVAAEVPNAVLLLVGDGPLRGQLERQAANEGIADRVRFAGSRSDVVRVLPLIDVVALSSFTIECFPYSILEAMGAGIPAVCTAVGGLPEMVEDGTTGYLVPPHDPRGLAARLTELLRDADLRERMGAAARRRLVEDFPLSRSVARFEDELERAVEDARLEAASA